MSQIISNIVRSACGNPSGTTIVLRDGRVVIVDAVYEGPDRSVGESGGWVWDNVWNESGDEIELTPNEVTQVVRALDRGLIEDRLDF